ncbi:MAG TPA: hypothetical protein GX522_08520 [Firmicutes bacterium]|nr:hypothetical protein [Bacillota bacterium]
MEGNIFVVLALIFAILFGSTFITIQTTKQIAPNATLTIGMQAKILDWSLIYDSDNFADSRYVTISEPGYYILSTEGNAPKGQITITIYNSSGKTIKSIHGPHLKKEQKIKLSPGKYKIVVTAKNAKHNNCRIYINRTH